ncbi:penicillin acylase family protein [Colwellia psychrerythraea]|uniref:Acyl-homoserine-lactone acylase n=1 Tax=Colwellia psychrerythraea TaxID=28229 RepID=A0A099L7S8_COLPS|nr:penicillin acylase family protein [Colwellia psychrerythraea]KGJ97948.1 Acyl-homoserine-lactone acylase [Colwellia psychrerythraea]
MMTFRKSKMTIAISLTLVLGVAGCNSDNIKAGTTEIQWTSYGVPHIKADNYTDLGEGLGYVMAKDRYCNVVDTVITAKSERAKYLGAGINDSNINSDFAYLHVGTYQQARDTFQQLDSRTQALMRGFASGFNHAIENSQEYDGDCETKLQAIDHVDVLAINISMNYWPFIGEYFQEIGMAEKPKLQRVEQLFNRPKSLADLAKGSNGWALGKEMTSTGKGMLLSNTHLPHEGNFYWYEAHLTIPDTLNVYGGFLPGFITPALGFNDTFSWTHTWTAATTGSLYTLTPSSNNQLSYQYGDEEKQLTATDYQINLKNPDGTLEEVNRTLYASHYGPMISFDIDGQMVTIKDAPSLLKDKADYWLKLALSENVAQAVSLNEQGYRTGSQNIIMADTHGDTFYADLASVPNLSDDAWQLIEQTPQLREYSGELLDGSNPIFEWQQLVSFEELPKRYSDTYVQNANESPWLVNMMEPLVNYSPLYGESEYEQSARTQLSLVMLENLKQGNEKVKLEDLQHVMADKRVYWAELLVDDLVERCQTYPEYQIDEQVVNLQPACEVLANWDKKANLNSIGSHIFREYATLLQVYKYEEGCDDVCWRDDFDVSKPLTTPGRLPAVLDVNEDLHLTALASAVLIIAEASIDVNASLSNYQQLVKGDKSYPIAGGIGDLTGSFSTVNVGTIDAKEYYSYTGISDSGYDVNVGDGFVFLLEFTEQGLNANSVLLYSQSNNPQSAHYFDQAPLIAGATYKPVRFTEQSIKDDSNLTTETLTIK